MTSESCQTQCTISEDCRARCIEIIKELKTGLENEIHEFKQNMEKSVISFPATILGEPQSMAREERRCLMENDGLTQTQIKMKTDQMKKLDCRLQSLSDGTFSGICPDCQKQIPEEELIQTPLRQLCVSCQKKKNGFGK